MTNVNIEISLITRIFKYISKLFIHFIIDINRKCFKSWRRHLTSNGIGRNHYSCFIEWNQLRFEYKKKKKKKTRNNIVFIRKNSSLCLASLTYESKINGLLWLWKCYNPKLKWGLRFYQRFPRYKRALSTECGLPWLPILLVYKYFIRYLIKTLWKQIVSTCKKKKTLLKNKLAWRVLNLLYWVIWKLLHMNLMHH